MRINKFLALHTDLSRRSADDAIKRGRVKINAGLANTGDEVGQADQVFLDEKEVSRDTNLETIILNKPMGYVCSRDGQGSQTIYDLLPKALHKLNPVGRLDKNSSGLLLMTNDGKLAQDLTHPSKQKNKIYEVELNKKLESADKKAIINGVELEDGLSKLELQLLKQGSSTIIVTMQEGRNRQIRRTFAARGYEVTKLHRTSFGDFRLGNLKPSDYHKV